MRLVEPPAGIALEQLPDDAALLEYPAAFGPGRRYWTMKGTAIVTAARLLLVLPPDGDARRRVALSAPISEITGIEKPRWSFGTGLFVAVGDERYTVEPEPISGRPVTPARLRRARQAARELEQRLQSDEAA